MRGALALAALLCALASAVAAEPRPVARPAEASATAAGPAPETAPAGASDLLRPRPSGRPEGLVEVMSTRGSGLRAPAPAVAVSPRPTIRADEAARIRRAVIAALATPEPLVALDGTLNRSDRPAVRPAIRLAMGARVREGRGGGLCGRASIGGTPAGAVPGPGACGIPEAVRITSVSGVALSRPTRMDCTTARALDDWVRTGVIPVVGGRGGGAVRLDVAAGYSCRSRNNRPGARLSEHSFGRAVDVSGLRLANGETISVLRDWGGSADGRLLRAMWRAACGPFGTVLGPESDRHHRDHFHFDTARYRSGPYCR